MNLAVMKRNISGMLSSEYCFLYGATIPELQHSVMKELTRRNLILDYLKRLYLIGHAIYNRKSTYELELKTSLFFRPNPACFVIGLTL